MAKKIVITHDGKDYTLEFNRRTVRQMEANGFVVNTDKPMTMVLDLFHGAFAMHHRNIQRDKTEAHPTSCLTLRSNMLSQAAVWAATPQVTKFL